MGTFLIEFLLGACRHRHQSRPFTLDNQTYKVCLDCGKKIEYSLERMAPLRLKEPRQLKIASAPFNLRSALTPIRGVGISFVVLQPSAGTHLP
jgi:hypothetical protein